MPVFPVERSQQTRMVTMVTRYNGRVVIYMVIRKLESWL